MLNVNDFDALCSIGLFDPDKMNQGIFGFRRYENASLSYTGIDMHEGENVGGWDTALKREEYNALYANQKITMVRIENEINNTDLFNSKFPRSVNRRKNSDTDENKEQIIKNEAKTSSENTIDLATIKNKVKSGVKVRHASFGEGVVVKITRDHKINVKFNVGRKTFVFPDAFVKGILSVNLGE